MDGSSGRTGKDLLIATRTFAHESPRQSWRLLVTTLVLLFGSLAVAALVPWWPVRAVASLLGALLMVRAFIFFHDYQHGAIFHRSRLAVPVMNFVGLLMLAPARSWRDSHNYHHANVAKVDTPAVGSFPVMSVAAWSEAAAWKRFSYRVTRHPLAILFAGFTVFGLNVTLVPLLKNPKRHWDSALAVLLHGGVVAALWILGGPATALFGFVAPYFLAAAMGAYLFYAQHNFPGVRLLAPEEWSYYRAALESSSHLRMGRVMGWFTGDIGVHHVHHLNPAIPFYRLTEAMAALPELQSPKTTSLRPRDVVACFRGNVWDSAAQKMVGYAEASSQAHAPSHRGSGSGVPLGA